LNKLYDFALIILNETVFGSPQIPLVKLTTPPLLVPWILMVPSVSIVILPDLVTPPSTTKDKNCVVNSGKQVEDKAPDIVTGPLAVKVPTNEDILTVISSLDLTHVTVAEPLFRLVTVTVVD